MQKFRIQDKDWNDQGVGAGRGMEGGVVGDTQIAAEPDDGGGIRHRIAERWIGQVCGWQGMFLNSSLCASKGFGSSMSMAYVKGKMWGCQYRGLPERRALATLRATSMRNIFRNRFPAGAVAAAMVTVVVAGCGRQEEPPPPETPKAPEFAPMEVGPRGAEAPPPRPPLRVVTGSEGIPEGLLEKWPGPADLRVEQAVWAPGEPVPEDGDLYVLTADRLETLRRSFALYDWTGGAETGAIHPMFLGHAFDPQNARVLPWRWSPWVFYCRQETPAARLEVSPWMALPLNEGVCWPREPGVVGAMRSKAAGKSANVESGGEDLPAGDEQHFAGREGCWERLRNGSARVVFLPAYYGLRQEGFPAGVEWGIPERGTLLEIEHLAVRAGCLHEAEAVWLVVWLLQQAQQEVLTETCGWFPVRVPLGRETRDSPRQFSSSGWLDRSEVLWLEAPPPAPAVSPAPDPTGANATAVPEAPLPPVEPPAPAEPGSVPPPGEPGPMEPAFAPTAPL
jgi:hypothetical protein